MTIFPLTEVTSISTTAAPFLSVVLDRESALMVMLMGLMTSLQVRQEADGERLMLGREEGREEGSLFDDVFEGSNINEGAVLGLDDGIGRRSMEEEEGDEEGMGGRITIDENDGEMDGEGEVVVELITMGEKEGEEEVEVGKQPPQSTQHEEEVSP